MPEGVGVSERVTSGAEDESACREAGDTGGASTSDVASSTSGIFSLRVCTLHRAQNQPLVVCWSEEPQGSVQSEAHLHHRASARGTALHRGGRSELTHAPEAYFGTNANFASQVLIDSTPPSVQ